MGVQITQFIVFIKFHATTTANVEVKPQQSLLLVLYVNNCFLASNEVEEKSFRRFGERIQI